VIRVLVTGATGQVGAEVAREFSGRAQVRAHDRSTLDLARPSDIVERVREWEPHVIVNAAAYTAVDRAESDAAAARAVNAVAPGVLGEEARRCGALLVHYSTDYVFDGTKRSPYVEDDATAPLNVYGRTKLEGERAVGASGCAHVTLRTSWVYAGRGRNFLLTMLRLAASHGEIRVVDDQHGAPTSSRQLARATLQLLARGESGRSLTPGDVERAKAAGGLFHASAAGATTWCGFAQAIFERQALRPGSAFTAPRVIPIPTRDYPTPARRPEWSVLSSALLDRVLGIRLGSWQEGLEEILSGLPAG
jgi:dTDP-4-dehydrorhamnose reductase